MEHATITSSQLEDLAQRIARHVVVELVAIAPATPVRPHFGTLPSIFDRDPDPYAGIRQTMLERRGPIEAFAERHLAEHGRSSAVSGSTVQEFLDTLLEEITRRVKSDAKAEVRMAPPEWRS